MNYDWDKIFDEQQKSSVSIKQYCQDRNVNEATFYKARKVMNIEMFSPDKIIELSVISLCINGHQLTIDACLLPQIIKALK